MKKYLLPKEGNFYKANLHCHSTLSDGTLTPEELKELYKSQGYSILAYTDHGIMIPHRELADESFLPLTGVEHDISPENSGELGGKTCHFNMICLDENMDTQILWHRTKYVHKYAEETKKRVKFDENEPDYERTYSPECISDMMTKARDANYFVTYNHPCWSRETYPEYINYNGMHAMEIMNTISGTSSGIFEYSDKIYEEMLVSGKRIFCIAADDCHTKFKFGHRKCDACKSWTMIKAKSLDYKSVAEALKNGDFYASEGPEIKELYYENGKLCITCSPADKIIFTTYPKRGTAYFDERGDGLTHLEYPFTENDKFMRVTVIDKEGKRAYTNAYFSDEVIK